ncbi:MAG: TetR/AcrR family transcriptional regulator [Acidimicrobiia bacterium]|nr:TetR/AcrR family transcriptional regulator [Acidimicrobiia bacterium]
MVRTDAPDTSDAGTDRRERRKAERREAILDAAQRLFTVRGLEATTMDDIARECDIAKGTLYLSFDSKDDIAFAVLSRALHELHETLRASVVDGRGTALERIQRIADAYYAFSVERPGAFRYLFLVPHPDYAGRVTPEVAEETELLGFASLELLVGLLRQGVEEKSLALSDPWSAAVGMWSALTGVIVIPTRDAPSSLVGVDHADLVRQMVQALLRGLHPDHA